MVGIGILRRDQATTLKQAHLNAAINVYQATAGMVWLVLILGVTAVVIPTRQGYAP